MIITRDQVKLFLGITTSDYDTLIDVYLPVVDGKVRMITNNNWNDIYYCNTYSNKYIEVTEFFANRLDVSLI